MTLKKSDVTRTPFNAAGSILEAQRTQKQRVRAASLRTRKSSSISLPNRCLNDPGYNDSSARKGQHDLHRRGQRQQSFSAFVERGLLERCHLSATDISVTDTLK